MCKSWFEKINFLMTKIYKWIKIQVKILFKQFAFELLHIKKSFLFLYFTWKALPYIQWAYSQRSKSRSESCFGTWFGPFPDLKAWFYPLWKQSSFKSGFWKGTFWIMIRLESLILRTCERKALSERDSCMCILEMHAEAMHGSISADCAVGTKYYLAVCRSCSWSGLRLQCLWRHVVQVTNPIWKRIAIRNGFRNVIRSFENRPNVLGTLKWHCTHNFQYRILQFAIITYPRM